MHARHDLLQRWIAVVIMEEKEGDMIEGAIKRMVDLANERKRLRKQKGQDG